MVDWYGRWTEGYPEDKTKWCDMDYMAAWIRSKNYEPKTTLENLIDNIYFYYKSELDEKEIEFFGIPDTREHPENLSINIPDVEEYVMASGGIKEFDFEG